MRENKYEISHSSKGMLIPQDIRSLIRDKILTRYDEWYTSDTENMRLNIRFRGQFCYIGSLHEPPEPNPCSLKDKTRDEYLKRFRQTPAPLCRLRYSSLEQWSVSLYNYCRDIYEPSVFLSGSWEGKPEEALDLVMQVYYPK